jgi:hypothetical protein
MAFLIVALCTLVSGFQLFEGTGWQSLQSRNNFFIFRTGKLVILRISYRSTKLHDMTSHKSATYTMLKDYLGCWQNQWPYKYTLSLVFAVITAIISCVRVYSQAEIIVLLEIFRWRTRFMPNDSFLPVQKVSFGSKAFLDYSPCATCSKTVIIPALPTHSPSQYFCGLCNYTDCKCSRWGGISVYAKLLS